MPHKSISAALALLALIGGQAEAQTADTSTVVSTPTVSTASAAAPAPVVSTPTVEAPVVSTPIVEAAVSTPTAAAAPTLSTTAMPSPGTGALEPQEEIRLPALGRAFNRAGKLEWSGHVDAFLGQYFYEKQSGALSGYADGLVNVAKSYSTTDGVFGGLESTYTGFKQVDELAGGGTLFQQTWDNSVNAKWIHRLDGGESFKPTVGFKYEMFRETKDESWGGGLFDYWQAQAGLGWEKKSRLGEATALTSNLSYDFFFTAFPNFTSLASQFGSETGAPNPGAHTLNSYTHQFTYRGDLTFPGALSAWVIAMGSLAEYTDQKLVNSLGQYDNANRADLTASLTLGASQRLPDVQVLGRIRPTASLALTGTIVDSDQNHFDPDPSRLKFVENYYSYDEIRFGPGFSLQWLGVPVTFDAGCELAYRSYGGRLTQNVDGSYTDSLLHQTVFNLNGGLTWSVTKSIDAKFRATYSSWSSNTDFQQTYVYDFKDAEYYGGLEWRF